jgi:hypothetical protein
MFRKLGLYEITREKVPESARKCQKFQKIARRKVSSLLLETKWQYYEEFEKDYVAGHAARIEKMISSLNSLS